MTRKMMYAVLQFLTYGMLIGFSFEEPVIGKNPIRNARKYEFPFIVSIARRPPRDSSFQNRHFCTGTLISRKNVLTANHCVVKKNETLLPDDVEIIAGNADVRLGFAYYPESWITFDKWMNREEDHYSDDDIAIITLEGIGIKPSMIKSAFLTLYPTKLEELNVRIAGWGKSEDGQNPFILKTAELTVISNEECISNTTRFTDVPIELPETHFCSVADPWIVSTWGDSGAPIMKEKNRVVGINLGASPPLKEYPREFKYENQRNTHLRLYKYSDFIEKVTTNRICK